MKIYIHTDIEGVAGVTTFDRDTMPGGTYYPRSMRLLTAELNAAIEGLLKGGAKEIYVWDGHGSGGIVFEEIHPAAKLIHGGTCPSQKVLQNIMLRCDAGVMLGQHAMAGVRDGDLNHTQSSKAIDSYKLNGKLIGEIGQFVLCMGALNKPVIMLTGDNRACEEIERLVPGITTVAVKEGLGRNYAISVSMQESRKMIAAGATKAMERHLTKPIKPLKWKGPYVLEKRYFHTDTADSAANRAGAERIDSQTVRLRSRNILDIIYA